MDRDDLNYLAHSVQASVPHIARHFGVEYVTLHLFRAGTDAQNKPYVRTNYPEAWVSHYLLNDYVRIDPVLQMIEAGGDWI
ncbi:MAG: autoinducer binding domain-containing protein [Paracoccaceae bacterium]